MFTPSPRYATLARQVARDLAGQIGRGEFGANLPGERWLAESLQVSRRTVRAALGLLRQEEVIETIRGRETRIALRPRRRAAPASTRAIGLLLPAPVDQLEPYSTVYFDFLRGLLFANGFRLETHSSSSFFSRRPGAALARLVARFPSDAWVLAFSNRPCQEWFHEQRLPAVIAGTCHEGLRLGCVDLDMHATARHAASHLLAQGHRRLALVVPEKNRAGDRRTEEGFLAGTTARAGAGASARVWRHDGTMPGLRRMTDRLLALRERPTALFIVNPYHYMGVAGLLAERGIRVPRDLSLLCRDDDYCLRYLPAAPSHYEFGPDKRARAIFSTLMAALTPGSDAPPRQVLLLPRLVQGGSVARLGPGA